MLMRIELNPLTVPGVFAFKYIEFEPHFGHTPLFISPLPTHILRLSKGRLQAFRGPIMPWLNFGWTTRMEGHGTAVSDKKDSHASDTPYLILLANRINIWLPRGDNHHRLM
jgi:hypothetical protein